MNGRTVVIKEITWSLVVRCGQAWSKQACHVVLTTVSFFKDGALEEDAIDELAGTFTECDVCIRTSTKEYIETGVDTCRIVLENMSLGDTP